MPDRTWFKDWFDSQYYQLLYQHRDEQEAMGFIDRLIAYLAPAPGARMVDIGCGRGRHATALADKGFDVTGIDLSFSSINEAKKLERENLHFFQHDMRLPFWVNYFDIAFNFFTSFGYFRTEREHNNVIRTIAQSLVPDGVFVIDYLNVHYEAQRLDGPITRQIGDKQFHISKWQDETHFYKQIQLTDPVHVSPRHLTTEKVAKFSLGDFTEMFGYHGMQVQDVFGDYQLSRYDVRNSPRMIIVGRK